MLQPSDSLSGQMAPLMRGVAGLSKLPSWSEGSSPQVWGVGVEVVNPAGLSTRVLSRLTKLLLSSSWLDSVLKAKWNKQGPRNLRGGIVSTKADRLKWMNYRVCLGAVEV